MIGTEPETHSLMPGPCPASGGVAQPIVPVAPVPHATLPGAIALYRALRTNPLTIWTREHFEAAIVVNATPLGRRIVVNDPDAIGRVLVDNAANYAKDAMQRAILMRFAGDSLFTAEGHRWRIHRARMAPVFTPARTAAFAPAIVTAAERCGERLGRVAEAGAHIEVLSEMATTAVEALAFSLFDADLGAPAEAVVQRTRAMMAHAARIGAADCACAPTWVPRWSRMRSRRHKAYFERLAEDILVRTRTAASRGEHPSPIGLALQGAHAAGPLTPREQRDDVAMLIGAGHETVSQTLAWALYLLSIAPDVADRVAAEAAAVPADADWSRITLPLTRAVLDETMRLYPAAPTLTRVALGQDILGGHVIRRNDVIVIAPWLVHRHRKLWDAPDHFDPSRFIGDARERIHRFAFIPFGAGPRICIGMAFALLEATIVLAHVVRAFRFRIVDGERIEPVQRVTLRPGNGIRMEVTRRA